MSSKRQKVYQKLGFNEKKEVSDLLVVGKRVTVELLGWNDDLGVFNMSCSVESYSPWNFSKAPLEIIQFTKRIRRLRRRGLKTIEHLPALIPATKVLSSINSGITSFESETNENVKKLLDAVFGDTESLLDPSRKVRNTSATSLEMSLDRLLASFLQLSVATSSPQFHGGKGPEGYLMKTPMHYRSELNVMTVLMLIQMSLLAVTLFFIVTFFVEKNYLHGIFVWLGGLVALWAVTGTYVYLMRPIEFDRTQIIPGCFVPGIGTLLVSGIIFYNYFFRGKSRRWVAFRPGFIAYFNSNYDLTPRGVLMVDETTTIYSPWYNPLMLKISNSDQTLNLHTLSTGETRRWLKMFHETYKDTRRSSKLPRFFARSHGVYPDRSSTPCQWYADAKFLYRDVYTAITNAKHEIFIAGWMISPELRLVRENTLQNPTSGDSNDKSLENVLGDAVSRGVKVHVIVYRDLPVALPNNSRHVKKRLRAKGVQVIRHAAQTRVAEMLNHFCCTTGDIFWSHHEKLVIVDQCIAFVGGIDLAFGRYDDHTHALSDQQGQIWPGKDYYNVRLKDFVDLEDPVSDLVNRNEEGRMPWHDIHCCVGGEAAHDVSRYFVFRWNRELRQNIGFSRSQKKGYNYILPATYGFNASDEYSMPLYLPYTAKTARVLRSVGPWSLSRKTDRSIMNTYIDLISKAKKFIYIENQFFNSQSIADALYKRIEKAVDMFDDEFRVVILLPQWPAFEGLPFDNPQTKVVLYYQHKVIDGIINRLRKHLHRSQNRSEADVESYIKNCIGFFSLRTAEIINEEAKSEQVYVHAKLMIIDDEECIIGSANLNGRSLLGTRDSEVCIHFRSKELCHNLRVALQAEHTGAHGSSCNGCVVCSYEIHSNAVNPEYAFSPSVYESLKIPNWDMWNEIADNNIGTLRKLFGGMQPVEDYTTIERARYSLARKVIPEEIEGGSLEQELSKLEGNLVRTPMRFLRSEKGMKPSLRDFTTYILPVDAFV